MDKPAIAMPLYNRPYIAVGNSNAFEAAGNDAENRIILRVTSCSDVGNGRWCWNNYVTYPLNLAATRFTAVLSPPVSNEYCNYSSELIYRISGDGETIYTSPIMTPKTAYISIDLDVSTVMELKVEIDLYSSSDWYGGSGFGGGWNGGGGGVNYTGHPSPGEYKGIINAIIITSDY